LIRVAILSDTLLRSRNLATSLAEDERLEIVEVRAFSGDAEHVASGIMDVLVTAGLLLDQIPSNGPPVVALTHELIEEMPPAPAIRAWLPIGSSVTQVAAAILAAANDLVVLTQRQASEWLGGPRPAHDDAGFVLETLTPRELQVLRMLADGLGNKEIAGQLNISDHTAKFHVAQILAKLRASSRTEAVVIGMRRGLVPV
jgi:DNA-binding NarL/FixJ family response regulator